MLVERAFIFKKGAKSVTYLDICPENTQNVIKYCENKSINNIEVINANIQEYNDLPSNKFDIIFLCGIYQYKKTF